MPDGFGSKAPSRIVMSTRPHNRRTGRTSEPESTAGEFVIEAKCWHHSGAMPLERGMIRATYPGSVRTTSWSVSGIGSGSIVSALPGATPGPVTLAGDLH